MVGFKKNTGALDTSNYSNIYIHEISEDETITLLIDSIYPELVTKEQKSLIHMAISIMNKHNQNLEERVGFSQLLPNQKLKPKSWLILPAINSIIYEYISIYPSIDKNFIFSIAQSIDEHFDFIFANDHIKTNFNQMTEKIGLLNTLAIVDTSISYNEALNKNWFDTFLQKSLESIKEYHEKHFKIFKIAMEYSKTQQTDSKIDLSLFSDAYEDFMSNVTRSARETVFSEFATKSSNFYFALSNLNSSLEEYAIAQKKEAEMRIGNRKRSIPTINTSGIQAVKVQFMHKQLQSLLGEQVIKKVRVLSASLPKSNHFSILTKTVGNLNYSLKEARKLIRKSTYAINISFLTQNLFMFKYMKFVPHVFLYTNIADRFTNIENSYGKSKRHGEEKVFEETAGFIGYFYAGNAGLFIGKKYGKHVSSRLGSIVGGTIGGFVGGPIGIVIGGVAGGIIGAIVFSIIADYTLKKIGNVLYNSINTHPIYSLEELSTIHVRLH